MYLKVCANCGEEDEDYITEYRTENEPHEFEGDNWILLKL